LAIAVGRCSSEFVRNDEASFRFRRYITGGQLSREFVREAPVPNFKLRDPPFPRVPRCPVAPTNREAAGSQSLRRVCFCRGTDRVKKKPKYTSRKAQFPHKDSQESTAFSKLVMCFKSSSPHDSKSRNSATAPMQLLRMSFQPESRIGIINWSNSTV